MPTTIYAYTPPEPNYPPYINISLVDGKYRITVRGTGYSAQGYHYSGPTASIDLEPHIFEQLHGATDIMAQRSLIPTDTKIYFD